MRAWRLCCLLYAPLIVASACRGGGDDVATPVVVVDEGDRRIWQPTSARIAFDRIGFIEETLGYRKERAELTDGQRTALESIRALPLALGDAQVPSDLPGARMIRDFIEVTDDDGGVSRFIAQNGNGLPPLVVTRPDNLRHRVVDFETWKPFFETISRSCPKAEKNPRLTPRASDDLKEPTNDDVVNAPFLSPDLGCEHAFLLTSRCGDIILRMSRPAPAGTFEISGLGECDRVALRVRSEGDNKILAVSESLPPNDDRACFKLTHRFDVNTSIVLVINREGATGGCGGDAGLQPDTGLLVLRVRPHRD